MKLSRKAAACLLAAFCFTCNLPGAQAKHHHREDTKAKTTVVSTADPKQEIDKTVSLLHREAVSAQQRLQDPHMVKPHPRYPMSQPTAAPQAMRIWPTQCKDTGGTLLFSDSPEYVNDDGILYQDTVSGNARILFYHLNNTDAEKKVAVILQNEQGEPAIVHVTRGGMSEPNEDYLEVGKRTQMEYFDRRLDEVIYVRGHGKRLLQRDMDETILEPGQLVYGVFDFNTSAPVKVSVIMYPADVNPYEFINWAQVLPKDDQRLRGTFQGMDRIISSVQPYDADKDGTVYFMLGDNKHDLYRTGIDATDGSQVVDYGNYGILYHIAIPTIGKDFVQYYLSPLGGVYAGAMSVLDTNGLSNLLLTPQGRTYFGDATPPDTPAEEKAREAGTSAITTDTELADLGAYEDGKTVHFEYSPPGASNLPVNIIMMPLHD